MNLSLIGRKSAAIGALALVAASVNAQENKPNVIYILADDLGYGDVTSFNPDGKFHTPAIDSLASEGVRFTNAHSTSGVSTPSRYSTLTGRYNWRTEMQAGVLWSYDLPLINKERHTVASMMSENGYVTGAVGKWHLGLGWVRNDDNKIDHNATLTQCPNNNGFDYSYIMPASLDIPPYIYFENGKPTAPVKSQINGNSGLGFWRPGYIADDFNIHDALYHFTDKAAQFIQTNSEKPFFLYLPLTAPHTPVLPDKQFAGKTISTYGDFVLMVDEVVRRIVAAVEKAGVTENTIIVFTSDNGFSPAANINAQREKGHCPTRGMRGHKADIYEGGHRVPFIVKAPSITRQTGVAVDAPISQVGLFATLADMLNVTVAQGVAPDSDSYLSYITKGKATKKEALRPVVVHSHDGYFGIIAGSWKLCVTPGSGGWSFPRVGKEEAGLPEMQLFNLDDNINEQAGGNLIDSQPQIALKLKTQLYNIVQSHPNDVAVNIDK